MPINQITRILIALGTEFSVAGTEQFTIENFKTNQRILLMFGLS